MVFSRPSRASASRLRRAGGSAPWEAGSGGISVGGGACLAERGESETAPERANESGRGGVPAPHPTRASARRSIEGARTAHILPQILVMDPPGRGREKSTEGRSLS